MGSGEVDRRKELVRAKRRTGLFQDVSGTCVHRVPRSAVLVSLWGNRKHNHIPAAPFRNRSPFTIKTVQSCTKDKLQNAEDKRVETPVFLSPIFSAGTTGSLCPGFPCSAWASPPTLSHQRVRNGLTVQCYIVPVFSMPSSNLSSLIKHR